VHFYAEGRSSEGRGNGSRGKRFRDGVAAEVFLEVCGSGMGAKERLKRRKGTSRRGGDQFNGEPPPATRKLGIATPKRKQGLKGRIKAGRHQGSGGQCLTWERWEIRNMRAGQEVTEKT